MDYLSIKLLPVEIITQILDGFTKYKLEFTDINYQAYFETIILILTNNIKIKIKFNFGYLNQSDLVYINQIINCLKNNSDFVLRFYSRARNKSEYFKIKLKNNQIQIQNNILSPKFKIPLINFLETCKLFFIPKNLTYQKRKI